MSRRSSVFGSVAVDDGIFNAPTRQARRSQVIDAIRTVVAAIDLPVAILHIQVPGEEPREVSLRQGTVRIGRARDLEIPIKDPSVSRNHVQIVVGEVGQIIATDLGSSRGTIIDGVQIVKPSRVELGSVLALGNVRIEVRGRSRGNTLQPQNNTLQPQSHTLPPDLLTFADGPPPLAEPNALGTPSPAFLELEDELAEFISAPTPQDLEEAARASVLFELEDAERFALLSATDRLEPDPGQVLLTRGQTLEYLYIILSGQVRLESSDGRSIGTLGKGQSVELLGALGGGFSTATVVAGDEVSLLRIQASHLRDIVARDPKVLRFIVHTQEWPGAARFRQLMRDYNVARETAVELISAIRCSTVTPRTRIAVEGTPVAALRIVNKGTVTVARTIDGALEPLSQIGEGMLLGGPELCAEQPHATSASAETEVELLEIDRAVVNTQLLTSPELAVLLEAFGLFQRGPVAAPAPTDQDDHPDDDNLEAPALDTFRRKGGIAPRRRASPRHVRQHDEMDCGAACLAMVAHAFGRKLSLASYRAKVHVTREGASMWSLVRAARATGFDALGVQCGPNALADLQLPGIALMRYHFVVIYKVTKTMVVVGDPGIGIRHIARADFAKDFSSAIVLLRPRREFFKQKASPSNWRKYTALAPGHVGPVFEILLASFVLFALGLVVPLLSQVVYDRVFVHNDADILGTMVIGMVAGQVLTQVLGAARAVLNNHVANRFDTMFSALVYRYIMRLPLNFFMVRRVGDILTRFRELRTIRQFVAGDALSSVIQVTSLGMYLTVLFLYSTELGYLALGLTPVIGLTAIVSSRKMRRLMQESFPAEAKTQGQIVEQMRALETIKSLGAEIAARWRWEAAFRDQYRNEFRTQRMGMLISGISSMIEQISLTGMAYVAARMAVEGELTVGKVIAVTSFAASITGPVKGLASQWTNVQGTAVAFGRVDDVLTTAVEPGHDMPTAATLPRVRGDIELRNVWFQYGSDLSPWVLKDVSLSIKRGETVALVGRSGSGKSTLVQMLNLLYRPTRGTILIDGQDVTTLPLGYLRDTIGMVMQDSHLFAGTVFENIAFGLDEPSPELIIAAARVANAHGFISAMKDGYETRLREGGAGLSGGQRQRISLARALLRRPSIIVLDEATSALDAESERAVVDAMKVFCRGRTSILIAHRLSTILHADRIVMLEHGRVIESGSHRELIARGGPYAKMLGAQLAL